MGETFDVMIPVDADAASVLANPADRQEIGRLVSEWLRKRDGMEALKRAMADIHASVQRAGLTDAEIDAELAAYNSERRERPDTT